MNEPAPAMSDREIGNRLGAMFVPSDEETEDEVVEEGEEALEVDLELGDEDEELDTEEDAEDEDEPEAPAFTVLLDGKEVTVSKDEARNGYLRQADYTRKTMAVADERKALEAERGEVRQQVEQYAQVLPQLANALQSMGVPQPDPALARTNPEAYVAAKAEYDQWASQMQAVQAEQQRIAVVRQEQAQAQTQQALARERDALLTKLPQWSDQAHVQKMWPAMVEVGEELGFTRQEIDNMVDHRAYLALHALAESRTNRATGKKKVAEAKKTAAPGTSQQGDLRKRAYRKQREKAVGSGKVEDIAPLMTALLGKS